MKTLCLPPPILRLQIINNALRFATIVRARISMSMVTMSMTVIAMVTVRILSRTHVLHLQHVTALGAAFVRTVSADDEPDLAVGVGGDASASDVLFVAEGFDDYGVFHRSYKFNVSMLVLLSPRCEELSSSRVVLWGTEKNLGHAKSLYLLSAFLLSPFLDS